MWVLVKRVQIGGSVSVTLSAARLPIPLLPITFPYETLGGEGERDSQTDREGELLPCASPFLAALLLLFSHTYGSTLFPLRRLDTFSADPLPSTILLLRLPFSLIFIPSLLLSLVSSTSLYTVKALLYIISIIFDITAGPFLVSSIQSSLPTDFHSQSNVYGAFTSPFYSILPNSCGFATSQTFINRNCLELTALLPS